MRYAYPMLQKLGVENRQLKGTAAPPIWPISGLRILSLFRNLKPLYDSRLALNAPITSSAPRPLRNRDASMMKHEPCCAVSCTKARNGVDVLFVNHVIHARDDRSGEPDINSRFANLRLLNYTLNLWRPLHCGEAEGELCLRP